VKWPDYLPRYAVSEVIAKALMTFSESIRVATTKKSKVGYPAIPEYGVLSQTDKETKVLCYRNKVHALQLQKQIEE
jgi:hypothetical protein